MRAVETHHVGNQFVRLAQRAVGGQRHCCIAMPTKGFQRLRHELLRLCRIQAAGTLVLLDQ